MKKAAPLVAIMLCSLQLFSCNSEPPKSSDAEVEADKEEVIEVIENAVVELKENPERQPREDEIRAYGIIKSIEDAQYPMAIVTVEFPERQTEADFNLNIEAISQTLAELDDLKGKYATLYYLDTSDNMLMDVHVEGKTLYGEYAPELDDSYESITGILSGAENETAGDLPSTIYVTTAGGRKMAFREFVTSAIAGQNGQVVTGYYYMKYEQTITYLMKSED